MIGLTGATGYIGSALTEEILKRKIQSRFFSRKKNNLVSNNFFILDSFNCNAQLLSLLKGVNCLIHCAGIAGNISSNLKKKNHYEKINVEFTYNLAKAAIKSGVKRFIFISSAKVNGESTDIDKPFKITDTALPQTPYSKSKLDAENKLIELSKKNNLEFVIIRSPAVYGKEHTGNIKKLSSIIKKKIPIPLGGIQNKRSFISIENLVDFVILCTTSKNAANQIFFISDDQDISTTELIKLIARDFNECPKFINLPNILIKFMRYFPGFSNIISQLFDSFRLDISYTKEKTGWRPIKKVNK